MLQFAGIVETRSSASQSGGPPGEAEVLALNPHRQEAILKLTGWKELYPGTLNLGTGEETLQRLLLCETVWREDASQVKYPDHYAHIPRQRIGYLYYSGKVAKGGKSLPVLIRRACNPLKNRLEIFSNIRLREQLQLEDGDIVTCEIA